MEYRDLILSLKKGEYAPVYLLHGEEPYYIDLITDYILKNVLTEEERTFNQTILYGKDTDLVSLINTARRYPMMANRQVVVLKEGQDMKDFDSLYKYVEAPLKSTLLVLNYKHKKADKKKKLLEAIAKKGVIFYSGRLYENKIPAWIDHYLGKRGFGMEQGVGMLLTDYLGTDLGKISNELDKLMIVLPENEKTVRLNHIEKYIGISKEYNTFELTRAIGLNDHLKVYRIINYFSQNQKDYHITFLISVIFGYFNKILTYHSLKDRSPARVISALGIRNFLVKEFEIASRRYPPARVKKVISLLREYDLKSKGQPNVSTDAGDLLKELAFKILN